ncbi:hypothetical protein G6F42_019342 [Rhizopus arrhizus]|nr:hypothetical protein G6F42_019342 [Rhizopus arrhizus]
MTIQGTIICRQSGAECGYCNFDRSDSTVSFALLIKQFQLHNGQSLVNETASVKVFRLTVLSSVVPLPLALRNISAIRWKFFFGLCR